MRIEGPEIYKLALTPAAFTVLCAKGTDKFSGLATNKLPKLYIVSISGKPVYVGYTKRRVSDRLREGWSAVGQHGYHGYAWRHGNDNAVLSVWCHMDAVDRNERDIETVEAEVVFLIRDRTMARVSDRDPFPPIDASSPQGRRKNHAALPALAYLIEGCRLRIGTPDLRFTKPLLGRHSHRHLAMAHRRA